MFPSFFFKARLDTTFINEKARPKLTGLSYYKHLSVLGNLYFVSSALPGK